MAETGYLEIVFKSKETAKQGVELIKSYILSQELEDYLWADCLEIQNTSVALPEGEYVTFDDYEKIKNGLSDLLNSKMPGMVVEGRIEYYNDSSNFGIKDKIAVNRAENITVEIVPSVEDDFSFLQEFSPEIMDSQEKIFEELVIMGHDPDEVNEFLNECEKFSDECEDYLDDEE